MPVEIKVPSAGESITTVVIGEWLVEPGGWVDQDQPVVISAMQCLPERGNFIVIHAIDINHSGVALGTVTNQATRI